MPREHRPRHARDAEVIGHYRRAKLDPQTAAMRAASRLTILQAANRHAVAVSGTARYGTRQLGQAVAVVRYRRLVGADVLVLAGFNP